MHAKIHITIHNLIQIKLYRAAIIQVDITISKTRQSQAFIQLQLQLKPGAAIIMLNKNTWVQKKARLIRSSIYLTIGSYIHSCD